jgi:hypothetical protein
MKFYNDLENINNVNLDKNEGYSGFSMEAPNFSLSATENDDLKVRAA